MAEDMTVRISADTSPLEDALKNLQGLSKDFGTSLTSALRGAAVSGKDLNAVLRQIGLSLSGTALTQGLKPLENLASSFFSSLFGGSGVLPFAKGGVVPFASGGVVSSPTYFPMSSGLGLAGEAGSEAILPLRRGSDGSLGVASSGSRGGVNVVFNVTTQDASSFRKSESQVTSMLARAVSRGSRSL
ncbi:MAG: phage tail tape measure protein [Rhizobiaceae bacterium]